MSCVGAASRWLNWGSTCLLDPGSLFNLRLRKTVRTLSALPDTTAAVPPASSTALGKTRTCLVHELSRLALSSRLRW